MAQSLFNFDARRARSYIFRLPLCTRLLLLAFVGFFIASLTISGFTTWGSLIPDEIGLQTMYRTNTYPFIHLGIFHLLLNLIAITPLLERFESENGSLPTLLLFTGSFGLLPGLAYTFIEKFVYRSNTPIQGASIWVFLLLAVEAMKAYKNNPSFIIGTYSIPTWTTPLIGNLFVAFLIPNTSFTGHVCGLAIGYLWGLGYIKFLVPSEKILRWIEGKLNLLGRLPHYVSVDQKTYGRYGVLPSVSTSPRPPQQAPAAAPDGVPLGFVGGSQRLGP